MPTADVEALLSLNRNSQLRVKITAQKQTMHIPFLHIQSTFTRLRVLITLSYTIHLMVHSTPSQYISASTNSSMHSDQSNTLI